MYIPGSCDRCLTAIHTSVQIRYKLVECYPSFSTVSLSKNIASMLDSDLIKQFKGDIITPSDPRYNEAIVRCISIPTKNFSGLYKPKQVKKAGKLQVQPARFDFSQVWSKFPWLLNYTRATCQICFVSPFQHLHWSPKCACGTIRSPICQCWLSSSSTTMAIFSCFLPLLHHFFFFGSPFPA